MISVICFPRKLLSKSKQQPWLFTHEARKAQDSKERPIWKEWQVPSSFGWNPTCKQSNKKRGFLNSIHHKQHTPSSHKHPKFPAKITAFYTNPSNPRSTFQINGQNQIKLVDNNCSIFVEHEKARIEKENWPVLSGTEVKAESFFHGRENEVMHTALFMEREIRNEE